MNGFIKKHLLLSLAIPFYLNVIFYGIYFLIAGRELAPLQWVTNLLGLTMMDYYAWFPIVLAILYLGFFLIFKNVKNENAGIFLLALVVLLQIIIFSVNGHFAWWSGEEGWWTLPNAFENAEWWQQENTLWFSGQWWINSSLAIVIGVIYAKYEAKLTGFFKKGYWWKLLLLIAIWRILCTIYDYSWGWTFGGYYVEQYSSNPGIISKLIMGIVESLSTASFPIVVVMIMMKFYTINPITKFFGKYSLDIYLMNLMPLLIFEYIVLGTNGTGENVPTINLILYIVLTIILSVILGIIEKKLADLIRNRFVKK